MGWRATRRHPDCYHPGVRALLRKYPRFFLWSTLAGISLRLLFLFRFPAITVDSLSYGDIAKNWLRHGIYGLTGPSGPIPTYTRLPGYPAFLVAIFAIFGMEHYRAVLAVQLFVDIGTCFLIADLARRQLSEHAARVAFLLAALCPFFANYAAAALTETLEIFFTVLALDLAIVGLNRRTSLPWIGCGLAISAAILLRPDGGLLLAAIAAYLLWLFIDGIRKRQEVGHLVMTAILVAIFTAAPLVPWTLRNLRAFHRFQPLAPRYANEANEFVPLGFNLWVKTWIVDYVSVEEIYWQEPDLAIDPTQLPTRAFDSPEEREQTLKILEDYNAQLRVQPELDNRFAGLAAQRIRESPLRYYIWLPALRIADMWLRPRTEILPSDIRWWEFNDEPVWSALAVLLLVVNLLYVTAAILAWWRCRHTKHLGLLVTFVGLRSLFLGTLENPEPRYMLECYPVVILLASAAIVTIWSPTKKRINNLEN
jgi:4-amino-4-deoxy-L-arabinose transferase-like glycosyltransferase